MISTISRRGFLTTTGAAALSIVGFIAVFHAATASPENETPKMALGDREPK